MPSDFVNFHMNKNKQGARGPDPKSPHGHAEEKKAKSKALEAKKGKVPKHYRGNTNSEGGVPFGKAPKGEK